MGCFHCFRKTNWATIKHSVVLTFTLLNMLTVHCEELWADDEGNCFRSIYSTKEAINYTYNCITGNPGLDLTQSIFYNPLHSRFHTSSSFYVWAPSSVKHTVTFKWKHQRATWGSLSFPRILRHAGIKPTTFLPISKWPPLPPELYSSHFAGKLYINYPNKNTYFLQKNAAFQYYVDYYFSSA